MENIFQKKKKLAERKPKRPTVMLQKEKSKMIEVRHG